MTPATFTVFERKDDGKHAYLFAPSSKIGKRMRLGDTIYSNGKRYIIVEVMHNLTNGYDVQIDVIAIDGIAHGIAHDRLRDLMLTGALKDATNAKEPAK